MIFRLLVTAGVFSFGFFLGREVGRAEGIRDRLDTPGGHRRVRGKTFESDDYVVLKGKAARGSSSAGRAGGRKQGEGDG